MQRFHSLESISETDSERQLIAASRVAKPLPPLPRGWSRVCHETGLLLRGIGLGIVVTAFQGLFTKNFFEPKKVAIRQSRITALLRTLIHAIPIGVAIFEIVLNWKGHLVGENFDKQNYLQFAAKAHEIAMQASIATILLSYIRYQISTGEGMPFGAILGSLQFLQVSYLWSIELWSSILSRGFQLRKKTCFAVLILICITIAATAGPSSASLLIPQQGLWPTASRYLAANVSILDLWPDRLDDTKVERGCAFVRLHSLKDTPRCPVSELYDLFESSRLPIEYFDTVKEISFSSPGPPYYTRRLLVSDCEEYNMYQYCASIPQNQLLYQFFQSQNLQISMHKYEGLEGYQTMHKNYYQPYTIASCVADVVKNSSGHALLRFPRIAETESELNNDREIVPVPGITKGQILNNFSGDNSGFRVNWVDLPMDIFNTGIPGVVIVNPQELNSSSYSITTCTLNAGWGSSKVVSSTRNFGTIYSHMSNFPASWTSGKQIDDNFGYLFFDVPKFGNISHFLYPQRRISVSKTWMEFLNPTILQTNDSTAKFLPHILSSLSTKDPVGIDLNFAELFSMILAVAIADTETGSHWKVYNDLESITRTCDTCLVFELEYSLFGWLYSTRETTTKLAIAVMLTYCALVLGHIIYSATFGVSSTAWDSVAELVALAMNSSPTELLQNTCAGIIGRQAFKTPVRVLAITPGHLELVFGQIEGPNGQISKLVMNKKYGELTIEDGNDDEDLESNVEGALREGSVRQSLE